jgi:hypothetical protein
MTYLDSSARFVYTYASMSESDTEALVKVVQGGNTNAVVGVALRCSDANHYYFANIHSNVVEIGKSISGSDTILGSAAFSTSIDTEYYMRFQAIGSTLKVKVWDALTTEPTPWNVLASDNTLSSGLFGIYGAPVGGDLVKFSLFSATNGEVVSNVPEPTTLVGTNIIGLAASADEALLVPSIDISAYEMWTLEVDTIATGGVLTFQGSNDGINFQSVSAYDADGGVAGTTTNATGIFYGYRVYRYLQVRQTSWTSGSTTGTLLLYAKSVSSLQGVSAVSQSGSWTVVANAGTNLNTSLIALESGGNLASAKTDLDAISATTGATTDAAITTDANGSISGKLRGLVKILNDIWDSGNHRIEVDGSGITQPISASTLPLPTGASTSAKQPALGTAGTASSDVISVQGLAGMTALKTDGSATTQPVSAASLPLPTGASTSAKQPALGTAGTASSDVLSVQGLASMTPLLANPSTPYPSAATPITAASGNVANSSGVATLVGAASKTTYITGFEITGSGATVGLPVVATVAGVITGTLSYIYTAVTGVLAPNTPCVVAFNPPIPSSTTNTDIVVTCPALGAGNTNNAVVAHGYLL